MAEKLYLPSKKKALATFFGLLVLSGLIMITPPPPDAQRTATSMLQGALWFLGLAVLVTLLINTSYVKISEDTMTYLQFDFDWKRTTPIKNIIGIGFPTRNWLIPVLYIWYDDPKNPGKDKYINIKQAVFDDKTLAQIALELKAKNPNIKIDEKLQKYIEKHR